MERQLQNLYSSEALILVAFTEMLDHASDGGLRDIIEAHIAITHYQKVRLERIGEYLHLRMVINDGKIILGLLGEIHDLCGEFPKSALLDVGITAKIQHIQHFQISAYETAKLYAKNLDLVEIEVILDDTLDEAYGADEECSRHVKALLRDYRGRH